MQIQINNEVQLGQGGFGSVFQGTYQNRQVAVKIVPLKDANGKEEEALQHLNHPNIVKLFHVERHNKFKYFAFELCDASLDQIFPWPNRPKKKYNGPKLPYDFEIFSQLASGLEYIHSKNVIHQDIKPANVLISVDSGTAAGQQQEKVIMKWADFGVSTSVDGRGTCSMKSNLTGTMFWCAPEVLGLIFKLHKLPNTIGKPRGTVKSDVFAMGLVFALILLGGRHLYGPGKINRNIIKGKMILIDEIERSHYAYDLFQQMMTKKPVERISSSDVVQQLETIKIQLAEKEKEMLQLCAMKYSADTPVISLTNQTNRLRLFIRQGVNINSKNSHGRNALHLICFHNSSEGLIDVIQLLIQLGIDVNGKDNDGRNALHFLCGNNSSDKLIDAIELLIQCGIDPKEKSNNGCNALHFLCANNSSQLLTEIIFLLIYLGIDVNGKNNKGSNALHFLCQLNSSERLVDAISILIIVGRIKVNEKDKDGRNALHLLCAHNSGDGLIDAIKVLITFGIQVASNAGFDARIILRENYVKENRDEILELLDRAFLKST